MPQVHKIMAGLLDQHELAGSRQALGVAARMGRYFARRVDCVIAERGLEHWHRVLDVEFGGMNEVNNQLGRVCARPPAPGSMERTLHSGLSGGCSWTGLATRDSANEYGASGAANARKRAVQDQHRAVHRRFSGV